jgi:predicted TIM-barrel fold metal-dependent hydrolase
MPHVAESLKELDYLCDTLKAPAIGLMTNYDGKWLGHPAFDKVLAALDARGVAVHVHPSMTNPGVDAARAMGLPPPVVEYSTDTTRAIANLIFTGAAEKFPHVKMIFSHGGGTMPYLIERFTGIARSNPQYAAFTPERVLKVLRGFFYDVAIVAHAAPLSALTELIPISQLVYGSDSPYRSPAHTNEGVQAFFDASTLQAITRDNVLRIMPSLHAIPT